MLPVTRSILVGTAFGLAGGAAGTAINRMDDRPGANFPGLLVSFGATGAGLYAARAPAGASFGAVAGRFLGPLVGQFVGARIGGALVKDHAPKEAVAAADAERAVQTLERQAPPWSTADGRLVLRGEPVTVVVQDPFAVLRSTTPDTQFTPLPGDYVQPDGTFTPLPGDYAALAPERPPTPGDYGAWT